MPVSILKIKDVEYVFLLDKIVTVSCALVILCPSIVPQFGHFLFHHTDNTFFNVTRQRYNEVSHSEKRASINFPKLKL